MKRSFTKYPTTSVVASTDQRNVLFEVSHTDKNGKRITGQLYTADAVSRRLLDLLAWGCYDITVTEYTGK